MDRPAPRRGDGWRGGTLLRNQPPEGPHREPGYEKLAAIAKAMGFPPEEWFGDGASRVLDHASGRGQDLAGRAEHLFEVVENPSTGEPYTNADVARATLGDLSEEEVEGIRTGAIGDPAVSQVAALAGVFGVEPSYLLGRGEAVFDEELVEALRDEAIRDVVREISRLSERERGLVLGIIRQFGGRESAE